MAMPVASLTHMKRVTYLNGTLNSDTPTVPLAAIMKTLWNRRMIYMITPSAVRGPYTTISSLSVLLVRVRFLLVILTAVFLPKYQYAPSYSPKPEERDVASPAPVRPRSAP